MGVLMVSKPLQGRTSVEHRADHVQVESCKLLPVQQSIPCASVLSCLEGL